MVNEKKVKKGKEIFTREIEDIITEISITGEGSTGRQIIGLSENGTLYEFDLGKNEWKLLSESPKKTVQMTLGDADNTAY
jgi:hypothetical protein